MTLRKNAINSILWSLVQNWGGRLLTFALVVIWARILTPLDYGIVAACVLIQYVITLFSEFGFGDAIIQREKFESDLLNIPFFISLGSSCLLTALTFFGADQIEAFLRVEGLAPVLRVFCFCIPLFTLSEFQEILYRREMLFKTLAVRVLVSNIIGGIVALSIAATGHAVWGLVAQTYTVTIISVIWLWSSPRWRPSLRFIRDGLGQITKFSASVFLSRILDFLAVRFSDFLILYLFGPAIYGIYTVGSRIYVTLMQLITSALSGVALTILAKVSRDREKLQKLFFSSLEISTLFAAPFFFMLATLSKDIVLVVFGQRWADGAYFCMPLLYLGGLQCVQYLNGPYVSAVGKPKLFLYTNTLKTVLTFSVFYFGRHLDPYLLITCLCLSHVVLTPLNYWITSYSLEVRYLDILKTVLPKFAVISLISVLCLWLPSQLSGLSPFLRGIVVGAVFAGLYVVALATIFREAAERSLSFMLGREIKLLRKS